MKKRPRLSTSTARLSSALVLFTISLIGYSTPAWALGPNLIANNSFEGGDHGYWREDGSPLNIIKDPANARTGSWTLEAKVQPTGSCNLKDALFVWQKTAYTTSVWYKGDGTLQLQILKGDLSAELAHVDLTATSSWQQASVSYQTGDLNQVQIAITEVGGSGTTVYVDDLYTGLTDGHTINFDPNNPTASEGFKLLWSDEFKDSSTIDVKNTQADGYQWYLHQFYGLPDTTPAMFSVADGVLTLTDSPNGFAETLHTAAPANNKDGFVGTVFRNTAPLYFESRFKIRNFDKTGTTKGNPAFWTQDIKMCTSLGKEMPGNPGHTEMIENDIVEMSPRWREWRHISGLIDWCDKSIGDMNVQYPPPGMDYAQYHIYGCLLVPATAANGWNGYRTIYLDGVPMISTGWIGNQTYKGTFPQTKESMGSYRFSLVDQTWGVLIFGTGQGGVSPLDVDYVRVYGVDDSSVKVVKRGDAAVTTVVPAASETAKPASGAANLLASPGFEDGAAWSMEKPFASAKVAENAHAGSGELLVTMPASPTYMKAHQKVNVAANTNYTSGLWAKGSGKFQVMVLDAAWAEAKPLAIITVTATNSWQQVTVPTFNSGTNAFVYFVIRDSVGGAGTVYFDDCFLHALAGDK